MTCEINFNEYIDLIPNDTINVIKKKRKYEINESVIKFINDLLLLNSKKPHKIKHINNLEGIEFRNDLRSKETVDTYIKNEKNLTKYFDKDTLRYYRKKKNIDSICSSNDSNSVPSVILSVSSLFILDPN